MSDTNANSRAFVRMTEIPPSPPPASETGAIRWAREKLFATPANSLLTVLGIIAVYYIVSWILPWFLNSNWTASNIRDCRDAIGDSGGACFAVLTDRWHQLLFGTYPQEAYWRIAVAFVGLVIAAAPILFTALPKRMLAFTGLYPFIAYWLIWGGTLWFPTFALAGFLVGYLAFSFLERRSFVIGLIGGAVAAVIWWMFIASPLTNALASVLPLELMAVESRQIGGFTINFILGTVSISLSLPFGILLALGRQSNLFIIKGFCVVFIEFIRGVPLITLLFVASVLLAFFLPPNANFDLIVRVIIMITMFASAYIAEVIRGGLAALPRGQYEAADALGLDYWQAIRFIILPQALKISIPGIVNVFIGLFKDTTLVSIISMFDMVGFIRGPLFSSTDWNGIYWEVWFFAAMLFFVFCYGISQYSQYLEQKLRTDHR